jgi:hypothetical protein
MDMRPKTILCDIDGTLVYHEIPACNTSPMDNLMELPGTVKKLSEWDAKSSPTPTSLC